MAIAERLWSTNLDLAYKSLDTPFVQGIKNGDLHIESFKSYIEQDSFFLEAFARAYGIAIGYSPDKNSITVLSEMLNGVIEELNLHEAYAKKWNVDIRSCSLQLATKNYRDFLIQATHSKEMVKIISAMTPCMRLYSWLGQLIKTESILIDNPYKEWINTYSDTSFERLASTLEGLIDLYYEKDQLKHIEILYNQAMNLELKFFEAYSP